MVSECYQQFYASKLKNVNEMDKFLEIHTLSNFIQEEIT